MRMLLIKQDTDIHTLGARLLSAKLNSDQTKAAIAALQALNPQADLEKIGAGTVLLVPDAPSFKPSATSSVSSGAFGDFEKLVKSGLAAAAARMTADDAAHTADNGAVTAVLRVAAVKRLIDTDADLKQQVANLTKTLKDDEQQSKQAEQTLATVSKEVLAKLTQMGKLLG
jgi:hypothetical protein